MSEGGAGPVESPRDLDESSFTPILRAVLYAVPGVLAVVFVDREGECVDYCSSLPPFDAKVIAAHMLIVTSELRERSARAGEPWYLHVHGSERDIVVRRISDDYLLVVVTRPSGVSSLLTETMELAVRELRIESGEVTPLWEPAPDSRVRVELRVSTTGWAYAPSAFWHLGDRTRVSDVLGRWIEQEQALRPGDPPIEIVCFMVRTEHGQELTLVHRVDEDSWERR